MGLSEHTRHISFFTNSIIAGIIHLLRELPDCVSSAVFNYHFWQCTGFKMTTIWGVSLMLDYIILYLPVFRICLLSPKAALVYKSVIVAVCKFCVIRWAYLYDLFTGTTGVKHRTGNRDLWFTLCGTSGKLVILSVILVGKLRIPLCLL